MQSFTHLKRSIGYLAFGVPTVLVVFSAFCAAESTERVKAPAPSLGALRQRVLANEAKASRLRMEYEIVVEVGSISHDSVKSGVEPIKKRVCVSRDLYAQDGTRIHKTEVDYDEPNAIRSRVEVIDGEVRKGGRLPDLMEGWITPVETFGWESAMPIRAAFRPFANGLFLSDLLVSKHASMRPNRVTMDGREAAVVEVQEPVHKGRKLLWIDLERGVPIRSEAIDIANKDGDQASSQESTKFHRLPNGGWFPVEGVISARVSREHSVEFICNRWTVDVNSISIDKKDIPDSLFDLKFPPGAKIWDSTTRAIGVAGNDPNTLYQVVVHGIQENCRNLTCGTLTWRADHKQTRCGQDEYYRIRKSGQMWWDGEKVATKVTHQDARGNSTAEQKAQESTSVDVYDGKEFRGMMVGGTHMVLRNEASYGRYENYLKTSRWPGYKTSIVSQLRDDRSDEHIETAWSVVEVDGAERIKMRKIWIGPDLRDMYKDFYFDPAKGYMLVKTEFHKEGRLRNTFTWRLEEILEGLWFPVEHVQRAKGPFGGQEYEVDVRLFVDLEGSSFNDRAAIPKGTFKLEITDDIMTIADHRGGDPAVIINRRDFGGAGGECDR